MPHALIIGGTRAIGRATARRLLAAGWREDLTGRDPARLPADIAAAGGRFVRADRDDRGDLSAAFTGGADLLVDCLCFTAANARMLLPLARHAGSTGMISAKAVYVDTAGNHANSPTHRASTAPSPRHTPLRAGLLRAPAYPHRGTTLLAPGVGCHRAARAAADLVLRAWLARIGSAASVAHHS